MGGKQQKTRVTASSLKSPKFVQINLKLFNNYMESRAPAPGGKQTRPESSTGSAKAHQRLISQKVFSKARQIARDAAASNMPLACKVTNANSNSYSTFDLQNKGQRISASKHLRGHTTFETVSKDPVSDGSKSLATFEVKQRLDRNFNAVADSAKGHSEQQISDSKNGVKTPTSALHKSK